MARLVISRLTSEFTSEISDLIPDWHAYDYGDEPNEISDGGNDMFDGGNQVKKFQ